MCGLSHDLVSSCLQYQQKLIRSCHSLMQSSRPCFNVLLTIPPDVQKYFISYWFCMAHPWIGACANSPKEAHTLLSPRQGLISYCQYTRMGVLYSDPRRKDMEVYQLWWSPNDDWPPIMKRLQWYTPWNLFLQHLFFIPLCTCTYIEYLHCKRSHFVFVSVYIYTVRKIEYKIQNTYSGQKLPVYQSKCSAGWQTPEVSGEM